MFLFLWCRIGDPDFDTTVKWWRAEFRGDARFVTSISRDSIACRIGDAGYDAILRGRRADFRDNARFVPFISRDSHYLPRAILARAYYTKISSLIEPVHVGLFHSGNS